MGSEMTVAFPLAWPDGWPRTKHRTNSKFGTSVAGAVRNVQDEMRRFGKDSGHEMKSLVISSNVTLVDQRPSDPGVACYFRWDNIDCCIAVDRYTKVEDNLQAIAKIVEAERTKLRHGGLNIVRQGFRGFAALPPPPDKAGALPEPWHKTLGVPQGASLTAVEAAYRRLVKTAHPDAGGDPAAFNRIADAMRSARMELGA
jgi:hypothetical protein